MSYYYEDGQLVKVRFKAGLEQGPEPHWYDIGTRIIFAIAPADPGQVVAVNIA
jgi:hypothetical protein